ncbi:hypothetical protein B5M09_009917 [Aphanomyces astaci]|uniref:C2 Aida-type domain-containing protein n=1 Tax=Aphanomyces astaci TaxID=112090 RepID=A0A425DKW2_APHAT|nr:hypothetical protein B5M09_009917 [Aphanomyces astaci]
MGEAVKADGWGQVLEAVEAYEKAAEVILADLPTMGLTDDQQDIAEKVVVTMNLRATGLSSVDGSPRPNKDDMDVLLQGSASISARLGRVGANSSARVCIHHNYHIRVARDSLPLREEPQHAAKASKRRHSSKGDVTDKADDDTPHVVTILIQKIGLKDVERYVDPQIVVSVVDKDLVVVEEKQDTSIAVGRVAPYIMFDSAIELRTHLHVLRQSMYRCCLGRLKHCYVDDSTIYFEFVHYKKAKRKKSVRCWAMLEMDEIKAGGGPLALELYTKPCDVAKKRVHLFTVKPLYLHVDIRLEPVPQA